MTPYKRNLLVAVIINHNRINIGNCLCGWNIYDGSHAEHIADVYEEAVKILDEQGKGEINA